MKKRLLNLTLLYVEDDADTREQLEEVFKHKVKNVYVARDGEEALELFKKHKIHLVVSDYKMPNMNGNDLCRESKKRNSFVSFVLLTAFNHTDLLVDAIDAGVDKFLQKPMNAKHLFSILDEIDEKVMNKFQLEKSMVCLKEAEKIALLSYWDMNLDSKYIHFSNGIKELFGLKGAVTYEIFSDFVIESDRERFKSIFTKLVYKEDVIDEMVGIDTVNKQRRYIHILAKKWESVVCESENIIGLFQDVTHYEIQKMKLLQDVQQDPMLKIYNKKFLTQELENFIKISKRYGHSVGVIFFDIDSFKQINDCHGHLIADDLLIELANLIGKNIRQSDSFGRWGGDEFVILTGYSSPESTIELANKLLETVNTHLWHHNISLTISMGLSFYTMGDDVHTLLNRADLNMLKAKKDGKNRYCH